MLRAVEPCPAEQVIGRLVDFVAEGRGMLPVIFLGSTGQPAQYKTCMASVLQVSSKSRKMC